MFRLAVNAYNTHKILVNYVGTRFSLYNITNIRNTLSSYTSDEYQYIQMSKVPTMHFQPSLPRLPIPKLENSCQKYLNAQRPLLNKEKFSNTESLVTRFLNEDGPKLQKELIQKDSKNRHTSYINEPWFNMYLKDRKPLPINYNPFLVFLPETDTRYNDQLVRSTNLVVSSLRFMKSLRKEILIPEIYHMNPKKSDTELFKKVTGLLPSSISWYGAYLFKAFPLDMSQYQRLFNTSRIPEQGKDKIYHDAKGRHLIVMRKGHFYAFDVLDENGYIRQPSEIAASLKLILEDDKPYNPYPIGILTTSERNKWASARLHLIDIGNENNLKKIDSALFTLILDDNHIGDDYNKLFKTYLHSDGTNRWFDKSFCLIVTKDGYAGLNFEHSWGDGVSVLRYFNDVQADISKKPRFHPENVKDLSPRHLLKVEKLEFALDSKIKHIIEEERKNYEMWIKQLLFSHILYEGLGKNECKKIGISTDAIMQLAFQLALYEQEGQMVPTYESCSTAAFKHGRTETIRSCTSQTKAACVALTQKNIDISTAELKKLIFDCSLIHNKLIKEAAMGQGFDRHLFSLKSISEESGTRMPAIFEDPSYNNLNHNILSTSTLSSPAILCGGFGPVVNDGYGIGYIIHDNMVGTITTGYQGNRNVSDYAKNLENALKKIHRLLISK
ncbi:carnitine O-palmitoyltransferase 2, mitochondrial [Polistes fuscatus]|uniref:carnitine O-palmitoyltransferase 2, mitochondrial n=1 Tax=Polistes fuscatus TaxID=30207 RepID=UPI001CA9B10D|nr:carnitine O-palmitoyltransferase 2, mitochondrial [Polistes fuscatus]